MKTKYLTMLRGPHIQPVYIDEQDIVRRLLRLRKAGLVGTIWAEEGRYWITQDPVFPYESRIRYSLERLKELVEEKEPLLIDKKAPASATGIPHERDINRRA